MFQGFDEVTAFVVYAEAVGEEKDVNAIDAVSDWGVSELIFDRKTAFAEEGEVGFGGVGGRALAGGGVGDDHYVASGYVVWIDVVQ